MHSVLDLFWRVHNLDSLIIGFQNIHFSSLQKVVHAYNYYILVLIVFEYFNSRYF